MKTKDKYLELIHRLEVEVPPEKLKAMCVFVMKRAILRSKKWISDEYLRYEKLAKQGVSFEERLKAINKGRIGRWERGIDYYERVLKNGFEVNDWHIFTFEGDEFFIKKHGLSYHIQSRLKYIIKTKEIWN